MRLLLLDGSNWHRDNDKCIFFEHQDPHAAAYELFTKIETATKHIPKIVTENEVNNQYPEFFYGPKDFNFRDIWISYSEYLNLIPISAKNPLFAPEHPTFSFIIIEPVIITLEDFFERVRVGSRWTTERKSALKMEYLESEE